MRSKVDSSTVTVPGANFPTGAGVTEREAASENVAAAYPPSASSATTVSCVDWKPPRAFLLMSSHLAPEYAPEVSPAPTNASTAYAVASTSVLVSAP